MIQLAHCIWKTLPTKMVIFFQQNGNILGYFLLPGNSRDPGTRGFLAPESREPKYFGKQEVLQPLFQQLAALANLIFLYFSRYPYHWMYLIWYSIFPTNHPFTPNKAWGLNVREQHVTNGKFNRDPRHPIRGHLEMTSSFLGGRGYPKDDERPRSIRPNSSNFMNTCSLRQILILTDHNLARKKFAVIKGSPCNSNFFPP